MKKIIIGIMLLGSTVAIAEEPVEKVWYCQEVKRGGLDYSSGKWEIKNFITSRYVIKQKGGEFSFPNEMNMVMPMCETDISASSEKFCTSPWGGSLFRLNTETGLGSFSTNLGRTGRDVGDPDSLTIAPLKCETF